LALSRRERRQQIARCAEVLAPYAQRMFRPPWGHQTLATRFELFLQGYKVVAWNLHAYDWLEQDSKWMAERLANRIQPGSIVLLHDAQCTKRHLSREPTLEAVDMLLNQSAPFCFANRLDSERGCTQNRVVPTKQCGSIISISYILWHLLTHNEKSGVCKVIQGGIFKPALLCMDYPEPISCCGLLLLCSNVGTR